jgi:anti-sigma factor RsiW
MADLTCDRCAELLGDYVEGRLAADVLVALEGHVASCAACAALVRDYKAVPGFVRGATDVRMPHDVEVRLRRLLALAWREKRD